MNGQKPRADITFALINIDILPNKQTLFTIYFI